MAVVHIRIGGREYDLACDNGQEDQLLILADEIDERVRSLAFSMGEKPSEAIGLLLTSLTLADELAESKREIARLSAGAPNAQYQAQQENRILEIENAMAETLEEIAIRIEKIADQVEMR